MWIIFDFRDKLKRLEHGTTYDSSVLLGPWFASGQVEVSQLAPCISRDAGGREGVLLYALWFQWAIERYLKEKVMDDEQSIIASRQRLQRLRCPQTPISAEAEIWWTGSFKIEGL